MTDISITQVVHVDEQAVRQMIADKYSAMRLDVSASDVSIRVFGQSGSGFSSSSPRLNEAIIYIRSEEAAKVGFPSSMTIQPDGIAQIIADRLSTALECDIAAKHVHFDVSGGGGSGYSSSAPHLREATVRLTLTA